MGGANTPKTVRGTTVDNITAPIRTVWLIRPLEDLTLDLTGFPDQVPPPLVAPMRPFRLQSSVNEENVADFMRPELVQTFYWNAPGWTPRLSPQTPGATGVQPCPGSLLPPTTLVNELTVASGGYEVAVHLEFENGFDTNAAGTDTIEVFFMLRLAPNTVFGFPVNISERARFVGGARAATVSSLVSFDRYPGDAVVSPQLEVLGVRRLAPIAALANPAYNDGNPAGTADMTFLTNNYRYYDGDGTTPGAFNLAGTLTLKKSSHVWLRRIGSITFVP